MGELLPPVAVSFLVLILASVVIMVCSRLLDQFWSGVLPARWLYYIISAPGVAIHECTHIAACLLTGAKVTKVVLFSKTGGSVTYQPPAVPVLGNVIIGTSSIVGIPLVLAGMTWIFGTHL